MQYESLIREAWRFTWRFRSLWVLGLFAGGSAGSSFSWGNQRMPDPRAANVMPDADRVAGELGSWAAANAGLLIAIGAAVALLIVAGIVIALIAQGGLTRAGADAAAGLTPTLGGAWSAGLRFFWRYLGLGLIVIAIAIGVAIVGATTFATMLALGGATDRPSVVLIPVALAFGLLGIALAFAAASTLTFAQRAIVIANVGPFDALRLGWRIFRAHVTNCAVLWVLSIALGIAAGIAIAIALFGSALPFVLVGALIWFSLGQGAALVVWVVLGVIALVTVAIVIASAFGTFFWQYWTLAYLRLSGSAAA